MVKIKVVIVVIIILVYLYILKIKTELKENKKVEEFYKYINQLSLKYIDHNTYKNIKEKYRILYKDTKKRTIIYKLVNRNFIKIYKTLDKYIENKNNEFINQEIKSVKELNDINGYALDYNQKTAVISDEVNTLVVAGAGSGKSLTIIGKIVYLVNVKKVKPEEILCISFTNDATNNLKKNLNKNKNYNIDILTFHKLSLRIIRQNKKDITIAGDNTLETIVNTYFDEYIKNDINTIKDLVNYFTIYINLSNIDSDKIKTLKQSEYVYNKYDYIISNYLYINGINYTYKYKDYKSIFYVQDTQIINYHNIENYKQTNKIELFEIQFEEGTVLKYLEKKLKEQNIKFIKPDYKKIINNLKDYTNYFNQLKSLIITFINLFKSNDYDINKFDKIYKSIDKIKDKRERNRQKIFIKITENIYSRYEYYLKENNKIDFNDMINEAAHLVNKNGLKEKYKYIIIDEYQDTSITKYKLIKSIINKTNSKLMVVGDDWQSIYGFTGCTLEIFLNFEKYYGFTKKVIIDNTYRNSQELIDIAGNFIMKNNYQLKKNLKSNKHNSNPIKIIKYIDDFDEKLEELLNNIYNENKKAVMILGRNNNDINKISKGNNFIVKDNCITYTKLPNQKIYFLTVHRSKGLEEENVILINVEDKLMGFPNKMIDDQVLKYVKNYKEYYPYEEERRLFYVALTRTKNNIYIMVNNSLESVFVKEIKKLIQ